MHREITAGPYEGSARWESVRTRECAFCEREFRPSPDPADTICSEECEVAQTGLDAVLVELHHAAVARQRGDVEGYGEHLRRAGRHEGHVAARIPKGEPAAALFARLVTTQAERILRGLRSGSTVEVGKRGAA